MNPEINEILRRWNWLHFAETNPFLATGLTVIAILGLSFLVYQFVFWILRNRMQKADFLLPNLIRKQTRTPGLFTFFAFGIVLVMPFLPVPVIWHGFINKGLGIFQIICVAWLLISIIQAMREFVVGKYVASAGGNNHRIRTVYTQYKIFERILIFIIVIMGIIAVLMTFESVRQIGVSLLASAGVLGVIVGFAAQKSLAGVLAGIQIAIAQPIRIDDVVVVEGDWGRVEEITLTYVIICLWDNRRLVVPIAYFIEKPFYNWTRTSDAISGAVVLQVDLTTNVEALRAYYLDEIAKNPLWDTREARVQVIDVQDRILHLRFVCSASNSDALFDLRCILREQLLAYLGTHQPESLPRNRVESIAGTLPNSQENNYQPQ